MAMWIPVLMIACWCGLMTPDSHGVRSYPADPGVPWVGMVASLCDHWTVMMLISLVGSSLFSSSLVSFLRCLVASLKVEWSLLFFLSFLLTPFHFGFCPA